MRLLLVSILAAATLAACSGDRSDRHVTVAGAGAFAAGDRAVVESRLADDSVFGFLHPAPTIAVRGDRLDVRVAAASDPDDALRFLLSHQGRFAATGESGQVWFDQADIADVQPQMGPEGRFVLRFRLTSEGGRRLARFATDQAVGSHMVLKLDDDALVTATLAGPLGGGSFQVGVARPLGELFLIARVIHSGALSVRPSEVTVTSGPTT